MPRLAANLSTLFKELPFPERFAAAARAGFEAVEYQYPYEWRPEDLAAHARDAGVRVVLHNMPRGDAALGEHGTACLPGREQRFREDLERAIAYANAVGCPRLHCMAGISPKTQAVHETYIANVRYAAKRLAKERMTAMLEPLSAGTVAGCFLTGSAQAAQVVREVGADNVRVQYDFFHMQTMEGNLAATLERLLPVIGHVQVADVPGRHEPGTGELNFDFLLRHLDRLGYAGYVGCEYNPLGDTAEGLKWAQPYLRGAKK
jgi:hydroxypyruvate isomerase